MFIEELKENLSEETRHFVDFPGIIFFDDFYDHVEELYGADITRFEADGTIEMWLEFKFRGYKFFVHNKYGDYEFYVEDEKCSDVILLEIATHFRQLLENNDSATENTEYLEGLH
ncbi:MAG: hypothetical protein ACR2MD_08095 [Aridibacter sp.]